MTTERILILVLAIPLILLAIWIDKRRWWRKPRAELIAMLASENWRYWKQALKELRRRGEDTSVHLPRLIPKLLANSRVEREATRITLVNHYAELREQLADFRAADEVDISRQKLKSLLEKYGSNAGGDVSNGANST